MSSSDISLAAARRLRGDKMPHVPPAAAPISTRVRLELEAGEDAWPEAIFKDPRREEGWRVALQRNPSSGIWYTEILLPQEATVLRYHFVLADGKEIREKRQKEGVEKPLFGEWIEEDFRIAAFDPAGAPPDWVQSAVIYQIFPDRFARGDPEKPIEKEETYGREQIILKWGEKPEHPPRGRDFFGGDLRGVIEKLDYIEQLGITCIYFTPIFSSPTNHRYDALDYMEIDPKLGTKDDLRELIEKARQRGIRVLLDGVFNHCSRYSIYFKAAQASKQSPYYRWFNFKHWPDEWVGWAGVRHMPELVECPEVEDFFFGPDGVALYWLSYGTAGWRTDVTPWITDEYWRRFRKAIRSRYPEAYLVSEDWGDATHRLVGDSFDATMNYRFGYSVVGFAGGRLSPAELDDRLETLRRDTPPAHFKVQMNLIDSHDTPRAFTLLKESRDRLMLAAALQLAYPGAPMIYYGDEAGLQGEYAEDSRRAFPWGHEDMELLELYRRAISTRRQSKALTSGDVTTVWIDEEGGYGFLRTSGDERVVALFNNGKQTLKAEIPLDGAPDSAWTDLLGQVEGARVESGTLIARVPSKGAAWLSKQVL